MQKKFDIIFYLALLAFAIVMRFLPHPPNVTPIAALALFSGVVVRRWYAFSLPLVAMIVSDCIIGLHSLVAFTWGCFLLIGVLGVWVRRRRSVVRIVTGSLAGSVLFYLVTNAAVWAFTPLYIKDLHGLALSYTAAIPFFRNMALGDLLYAGVLFGSYALATAYATRRSKTHYSVHTDHATIK